MSKLCQCVPANAQRMRARVEASVRHDVTSTCVCLGAWKLCQWMLSYPAPSDPWLSTPTSAHVRPACACHSSLHARTTLDGNTKNFSAYDSVIRLNDRRSPEEFFRCMVLCICARVKKARCRDQHVSRHRN